MQYIYSIGLMLLFSTQLLAQSLGEVTIYNTSNSELLYNQVNCIEFDSENRLWIGTANGLSVFEETNNNWSSFNMTETPWCNLPTNIINTLEWANDLSSMFVGTTSGIINYLENGEYFSDDNPKTVWSASFGNSCNPNNGVVNCLFYNDGLWAGSTDGLCVQYLGPEGNWLLQNNETGFYSNNITCIKENTNNGIISIGSMNGGLIMYNDSDFYIYYSSNSDILDNTVLDVAFDINNNIILCTPQAGLGVLTESGSWIWFNTFNSSLPTNSLKNIVVDNNNNLWITTLENGLIHYNNGIFYNYTEENSNLPDNNINCLKFGPNNNLWLGTENSGVVKISNSTTSIQDDLNLEITSNSPDILQPSFKIDILEKSTVEVFNGNGQLINYYKLPRGTHNIASNYNPGLYFVKIKNKKSKRIFKLIQ